MRVLAAEDDPALRSVLARSLRGWGYEAVAVADGTEAWAILKHADAPTIAVLDWDMPGLTGLEVCRLLRTTPHGRAVYVVMLTGRHDKEDLVSALEAGADDFLSKPFHSRELQLRLAKGVTFQASRAIPPSERILVAPPSGSTLADRYRLERRIAEGGMASVWLGVHLALGINVAIKFMKPGVDEMPDYTSFEREARAAAQLRSEHIMRVYDHGIANDGSPYLVMEYLAGESLADRIERVGPLAPAEAAAIVEQIGRALNEAHTRGIVHRDVKPENILLVDDPDRPYGLAKLVDFGLARSRAAPAAELGGLISGTPSYMSPEYLRGKVAPNPLLDLWGLAVTAFCALTARIPFEGETLRAIVHSVCTAPLPVPSELERALPAAVDAWFARACARPPSDRYQGSLELAKAFSAACMSAAPSLRPSERRPEYAPTLPETLPDLEP